MLLAKRSAVVYGAAGAVGGAVARAFAREGAHVFLAGRTLATLGPVAEEIRGSGGLADAAEVDALDESAVENHLDAVIRQAGVLDVSFNAIRVDEVQGTPLMEMSLEDFSLPILSYPRTQFLTARAAGRHMSRARSGVILTLSTSAAQMPGTLLGGFGVACAAVEALSRNLAGELGPHGVRVVCLRPDRLPETAPDPAAAAAGRLPATLLGRLPTLSDVANTAVFVASDHAAAMTSTVVNLTCGSTPD